MDWERSWLRGLVLSISSWGGGDGSEMGELREWCGGDVMRAEVKRDVEKRERRERREEKGRRGGK